MRTSFEVTQSANISGDLTYDSINLKTFATDFAWHVQRIDKDASDAKPEPFLPGSGTGVQVMPAVSRRDMHYWATVSDSRIPFL
jgi:hypothetical protein